MLNRQPIYQLISALQAPAHEGGYPEARLKCLERTVATLGFSTPIVIDANGTVLAGYGRLEAARALGIADVPCLRVEELSEADKQAYLHAQHRLAIESGWDEALLVSELRGLLEAGISSAVASPGPEDDALPDLDAGRAVTCPGDLWVLGSHRLLCAEATDRSAYARIMSNQRAEMVFTDPLCHAVATDESQHLAGKGSCTAELTRFLTSVFVQLVSHSADGSIHFICSDWRHMREVLDAGEAVYGKLQNLIVWVKDAQSRGNFCGSGHELVFAFEKIATSPARVQCRPESRYRRDIWQHPGIPTMHVDSGGDAVLLPTMRPVSLVCDAIVDSTEPDDLILDAFCGSGSVIVAAEKTGRKARALEADPAAADRAVRRWQVYTGQSAVLDGTGESFALLSDSLE